MCTKKNKPEIEITEFKNSNNNNNKKEVERPKEVDAWKKVFSGQHFFYILESEQQKKIMHDECVHRTLSKCSFI